jgi:hypothetical protein
VIAKQKRWEAIYQTAEYDVALSTGVVTLRIGHHDAEAERRFVAETGVTREWFIITPCNPRSELAREELNLFYFNQLRYEMESKSGQWSKAVNRDPSGQWPDEPGFFVADPDRIWIMELGRRFYQNALVTAELGAAPRLLWL